MFMVAAQVCVTLTPVLPACPTAWILVCTVGVSWGWWWLSAGMRYRAGGSR